MAERDKKAIKEKKEPGRLCSKLLQEITFIYVFLMLTAYPFYFRDKYYDIGNAKWQFFFFLTAGTGAILSGILLFHIIGELKLRELQNAIRSIRLSVIDRFVLAYAAAVLISVLLSPYRAGNLGI